MAAPNSDSKRVAKNTLLLYIRMLVMMAIGLYTSRITLNALGVEDYGIYNVVGGIVVMLSFLNASMAGATQRYLNVAIGRRDQLQLNNTVSNALILHVGISIACFILAETIGLWFLNHFMVIPVERIGAANWVYQLSVFTFMVSILMVPYRASIIAHEKMSAFAWLTIFDVIMKLVVVCSLLFVETDKLILYAILLFFQHLLTRLINIWYCYRHFEECRVMRWTIDKSLIKSMLSFSSWTIIGNLGYLAHTQGIGILLNLFFGVTVNAAQGVANQVNSLVRQFVTNFLTAFNPQVVKTYAAGEFDETRKLVLRGSKTALLMVSFFVVPLIIETPTILLLWLKIVPDYAIIFVRLILLLTFFDAYTSLLSAAKGATGVIKAYQITLTTIGLFHLPLAWVCFALGLEPYWAQIVYVVIIVVLQIVRTWFVCRSIQLSQRTFYTAVVGRCYFSVALAAILPLLLHYSMDEGLLRIIVVCGLCFIFSVITALFIGFDKNERTALLGMVLKKRKK